MDAFEYRFTSKTGDIYIVRILNDGARFLSSEIISALEKYAKNNWMLLRESSKTCLMVLANRADFLIRLKDGDKDYKSMLPCYYVEKTGEGVCLAILHPKDYP